MKALQWSVCPCFPATALYPDLTPHAVSSARSHGHLKSDVSTQVWSLQVPTFFCQSDQCFYHTKGNKDCDVEHMYLQEEALGSQKCSDVTGVSHGGPVRICPESKSPCPSFFWGGNSCMLPVSSCSAGHPYGASALPLKGWSSGCHLCSRILIGTLHSAVWWQLQMYPLTAVEVAQGGAFPARLASTSLGCTATCRYAFWVTKGVNCGTEQL